MFGSAVVFLLVAILAGVLGFDILAHTAAAVAKAGFLLIPVYFSLVLLRSRRIY